MRHGTHIETAPPPPAGQSGAAIPPFAPSARNAQSPSEETWRPYCWRCRRARILCLCRHVRVVENRVEVLFLQHPNERRMPVNTARLALLSLSRARLIEGVSFQDHPEVHALLTRGDKVGLLFPSASARELRDAPEDLETLVILDGTWREARKMIHLSPVLRELPHYAFVPEKPSNYRIRKEPEEGFISTIEAVVQALRTLERTPERYGELLDLFDRMVDRQIDFHRMNDRPGRRSNRREDTFHLGHLRDILFRMPVDERHRAIAALSEQQRLGIANIARELFGVDDILSTTPLSATCDPLDAA